MIPGVTYPKHPFTIGVGGVVPKQDRVLLVKLAYGHRGWMLPGGYIEPNETISDGIKREVREETGLLVEPVELVSVRNRIRDGRNDLYLAFLARAIGGELRPDGKETLDAAYFTLSEMEGRSDIPKLNTIIVREFFMRTTRRFRLSSYKPDLKEIYELWA